MNEGTFELNKLGWYTVQNVQPNDFLNQKLESDQYGTWWSVKFQGDANTFIWQAKNKPTDGERVYGHLEKTTSGKSVKFRRAKREDTPQDSNAPAGSPAVPHKGTDESIARAVALKAGVEFNAGKSVSPVDVIKDANVFLAWLKQSPIQAKEETEPIKKMAEAYTELTKPDTAPNPKRPWENRTPAQPAVDPELASLENTGMPFEGRHYNDYDDEGNLIG